MKVLELLTEGFLADQRERVSNIRQEVANTLKLPRHRVFFNRIASNGSDGIRWIIAAPVPGAAEGEDAQFHLRMFRRLFEREMAKKFEKWKIEKTDSALWENGKVPTMTITFFTPDMDGLLP